MNLVDEARSRSKMKKLYWFTGATMVAALIVLILILGISAYRVGLAHGMKQGYEYGQRFTPESLKILHDEKVLSDNDYKALLHRYANRLETSD